MSVYPPSIESHMAIHYIITSLWGPHLKPTSQLGTPKTLDKESESCIIYKCTHLCKKDKVGQIPYSTMHYIYNADSYFNQGISNM